MRLQPLPLRFAGEVTVSLACVDVVLFSVTTCKLPWSRWGKYRLCSVLATQHNLETEYLGNPAIAVFLSRTDPLTHIRPPFALSGPQSERRQILPATSWAPVSVVNTIPTIAVSECDNWTAIVLLSCVLLQMRSMVLLRVLAHSNAKRLCHRSLLPRRHLCCAEPMAVDKNLMVDDEGDIAHEFYEVGKDGTMKKVVRGLRPLSDLLRF